MDNGTVVTGIAAAPLIAAFVSFVVKPLIATDKWYPLISIVLGIIWCLAVTVGIAGDTSTASITTSTLLGVMTGLAAGGAYGTAKALTSPR